MCNECVETKINVTILFPNNIQDYDTVINYHHINKNKIHWHCLSGPARIFLKNNSIVGRDWYIDGKLVLTDSCQEEFEKTTQYREWKLKVFK